MAEEGEGDITPEISHSISQGNQNHSDVSHGLPSENQNQLEPPLLMENVSVLSSGSSTASDKKKKKKKKKKDMDPNAFQKLHSRLQSRSFKIKDFVSDKADRFKHFITSRC